MKKNFFKDAKFWCFVGGVLAATAGVKALTSKTARKGYVAALAKGMQAKDCAAEALASIKEEAQDICYDARQAASKAKDGEQAGEEEKSGETEEEFTEE